jgi:hypothetical protein
MMVVLGYALNSILSSSGAAVKMIASINKSTGKSIGTALAGLRLRHRDMPNAHPLLIQKILTPQVRVYSTPTTFNEPDSAGPYC